MGILRVGSAGFKPRKAWAGVRPSPAQHQSMQPLPEGGAVIVAEAGPGGAGQGSDAPVLPSWLARGAIGGIGTGLPTGAAAMARRVACAAGSAQAVPAG